MSRLSKNQLWALYELDQTTRPQPFHDGRTLRALQRRGLVASARWTGSPTRWTLRLSLTGRKLVGELHQLSQSTMDLL